MLNIREMTAADSQTVADAFAAQGWRKLAAQYQRYLAESAMGLRSALLAEVEGEFAGYVTIVWQSSHPPFLEAGIPEIVDFNVLKKFQRRGIGSALLDEAERRIAAVSPVAGIGVGLTADYGAAQRLYARRGYIPDGNGIYQYHQALRYGETVTVDDGLALYLTKTLSIK
jgi:GNAT superfamily N-acetyltransferase